MAFVGMSGVETPQQECERLAAAPVGSINHTLAQLPVVTTVWPQDLLLELPRELTSNRRIVVVPIEFHHSVGSSEHSPKHRYGGGWDCAVVYSEHDSYPVGGYRISVPAAQTARSTRVSIENALPGV